MSSLPSLVAGIILLLSALAKAADLRHLAATVHAYRLLPPPTVGAVAAGVVMVQAAAGGALLAGRWPGWAEAAAALLTLGLGAVGQWAVRRRHLADCGCHGRLLPLSAGQSLAFDAGLLALLAGGGCLTTGLMGDGAAGFWPPPRGTILPPAAALLAGGCALASWRRGGPLFDLTAARPGRRWRAGWLRAIALPETAPDVLTGNRLVLFLTVGCARCEAWALAVDALERDGQVPPVLALVRGRAEGLGRLRRRTRLALAAVPEGRFDRLTAIAPAVAVLDGGRITALWRDALPSTLVDHLNARRGRNQFDP